MDRFMRGFIAGAAGGILMNIWSFIAYNLLKLPIRRFLDWQGVLLYGNPPQTMIEGVYALLIQIVWAGFLGILFSLLIPFAGGRRYLLKGIGFGLVSGIIMYAIPVLFREPYLSQTNFATVLSNHFGAVIWGGATAQTLYWLDRTGLS